MQFPCYFARLVSICPCIEKYEVSSEESIDFNGNVNAERFPRESCRTKMIDNEASVSSN